MTGGDKCADSDCDAGALWQLLSHSACAVPDVCSERRASQRACVPVDPGTHVASSVRDYPVAAVVAVAKRRKVILPDVRVRVDEIVVACGDETMGAVQRSTIPGQWAADTVSNSR